MTGADGRAESLGARIRRHAREFGYLPEDRDPTGEGSGSPVTTGTPSPETPCQLQPAPQNFASPADAQSPPRQRIAVPTMTAASAAAQAATALRSSHAYLTGNSGGADDEPVSENEREGGLGRRSGGGDGRTGTEEEAAWTAHRLREFRKLMLDLEYNVRWDAQQATWRQCRDHWRDRVRSLAPGAETCAMLSKYMLGA